MNGIGAHTGQTYIQTFIFIDIDVDSTTSGVQSWREITSGGKWTCWKTTDLDQGKWVQKHIQIVIYTCKTQRELKSKVSIIVQWRCMGKWRYVSTILVLGTRWRSVVSFTPLSLYPHGKSPGNHRIGDWLGSRDGLDAAEKRTSCTAGNGTLVVQRIAHGYIDWPIPVPSVGTVSWEETVFQDGVARRCLNLRDLN
jgi:hypothetical protein